MKNEEQIKAEIARLLMVDEDKLEAMAEELEKRNSKKSIEEYLDTLEGDRETKKKILELMLSDSDKVEELEKAAEQIAPDFNYEEEGKKLALEDKYGPLPEPPVEKEEFKLKLNYEPRTAFGRKIMSDRNTMVLFVCFALLVLTIAIESVKYAVPQHITVVYKAFGQEDVTTEYDVKASTVRDALDEAGILVEKGDYVSPVIDSECTNNMTIEVKKAVRASAEISGSNRTIFLVPGTVRENLLNNNVSYDLDDIVVPDLSSVVAEDTHIIFKEVHTSKVTKTEDEQPRYVVKLDPTLESGVKEVVEGKAGRGVFEYVTTYINGQEAGTERKVKKWIKEPVDTGLRLGTSLTGTTGEYVVQEEFTAECTAYWMGDNARGAAGGHCVYGTCAVDPSRFPYGTLFWVEGYGDAIANDCGGAIKGNILDLWMHDYDESCRWGRQWVTAYVLVK